MESCGTAYGKCWSVRAVSRLWGRPGNGATAVEVARDLKPNLIIMDVMMPQKDGIEACREITDMLPETKVLILTASSEEDAVVESVAAGATGYLQKYSGKEHLLGIVRDVARGVSPTG